MLQSAEFRRILPCISKTHLCEDEGNMNLGHYTVPHIRKLTFQGLQYVKKKWK